MKYIENFSELSTPSRKEAALMAAFLMLEAIEHGTLAREFGL